MGDFLTKTIDAYREGLPIDKIYANLDGRRATFFKGLKGLDYRFHLLETPANNVSAYRFRFFPGKSISQASLSSRFIARQHQKGLPLSFPNLIVSGWSPWATLCFERYDWVSRKHVHTPRFSQKLEFRDVIEKDLFEKMIHLCAKNHIFFLNEADSMKLIDNAGPMPPWVQSSDMIVRDILFGGMFYMLGEN